MEKAIANAIRFNVKVDATGLSPVVASAFIVGEEDAARAALRAIEECGYAVVPKEPTEAMKLAGGMIPDAFKGTGAARGNADRVYRAMIAAA